MTGTISLRANDLSKKPYGEAETVIGEMGYQYHFNTNEHKSLADINEHTTLAANATVKFGSSVQQSVAPNVLADVDDGQGRT